MRYQNSYHTDIILQYRLELLPGAIKCQIPSSTLHNWKKRDMTRIVGYEQAMLSEENLKMIRKFLSRKKLLMAAKALYFVYQTFSFLVDKAKDGRKLMRDSRQLIVQTVERIKGYIGLKRALKAFGISSQQFYAWKNKLVCPDSALWLCRKRHPNQLSLKEVDAIKKYLENIRFINWSLTAVYFQMMRDKAAAMAMGTFYKYARILNLQRHQSFCFGKKKRKGIRAEKPKEILHMDITIFRPVDHTRIYIYFIVDNFSRAILGWRVATECRALIACENLREVCQRHHLFNNPVCLIVDGGPENNAEVNRFVLRDDVDIKKLVAQKDIIFSNSMVEAVNKRMKYDFLFTKELLDYEQTAAFLEKAVEQYNHKPHYALHGYTPAEVLNGSMPERNWLKKAISEAKVLRRKENQKESCPECTIN